jgi:hypothetical protein
MIDVGTLVAFKPVPGGYVYRAPSAWLFGPRNHYLVNEAEKAEILSIIRGSSGPVLWIAGLSSIASIVLGAGLLWTYRSSHPQSTLADIAAWIIMIVLIFAGLLISRGFLMHRLRPILAGLPLTNERITTLEARQLVAKAGPGVILSPMRRRVVRIACLVGSIAYLGAVISGAIDAHGTDQSMLFALYKANANFSGLLTVVMIFAFGFMAMTFGRDRSPK